MKQGLFTIESNCRIADRIFRMILKGDCSAFVRGGQFADIALEGRFLRRPFAAQDWTPDGFSLIYKVVGEGTAQLASLPEGGVLDVLTGLGNGFDSSACRHSALVVCGGIGSSPAFSLVKQLLSEGKKVSLVLGFNTAAEIVLEDEYRALGVEPLIVTVDGSKGRKGFVTDNLPEGDYDYFYTCGPKVMMQAVCGKLPFSGEASLEERMGCGCGICYGCTCHTKSGPARVCADGPGFKKEDIVW